MVVVVHGGRSLKVSAYRNGLSNGCKLAITIIKEKVYMNRRKKINQILKKRAKQKNDKLNPKAKPAYVPKSEREATLDKPEV